MKISSRSNGRSMLIVLGLTSAAALVSGGVAFAVESQEGVKTTPVLTTDSPDLKWQDIGDLPPGAKFAVLAHSGTGALPASNSRPITSFLRTAILMPKRFG